MNSLKGVETLATIPGITSGRFLPPRTITESDTATASDTVILCNATGGNITVTLPAIATNKGKVYFIKKIDSSGNTVTIDGAGSETIDGDTTQVIMAQYTVLMIVGGSSEWHILAAA